MGTPHCNMPNAWREAMNNQGPAYILSTGAARQPVWNADLVGGAPGHELLYELQVQGQVCTGTAIPAFGQDHPQHAEELLLRHAADAVQGGCRAVGQCEQHHVIVVQHGTHPVQDGYWLSSTQVGTLATESQGTGRDGQQPDKPRGTTLRVRLRAAAVSPVSCGGGTSGPSRTVD